MSKPSGVTAVSRFYLPIKFLRENIDNHTKQRAEQHRIQVENMPNDFGRINDFVKINKAEHTDRNENQPKVTPCKMPVLFIKENNCPITDQRKQSAGP